MFKRIETENVPFSIGLYSQGIIYKNFIFVSGQILIEPKTKL